MTWLDRTIGWLSPEAGLRRYAARRALEVVGKRAYDAAKSGRRTGGWTTGATSANAEIAPALATLRARAREQVRNNPHAASAVRKLAAKLVGTGIIARPAGKQQAAWWKEWTKVADFEQHFDFCGLQNLAGRGMFESGEVLIRRVIDPQSAVVPLRLQVLEADYIDATRNGPMENGNYAIAGVEIDRFGRRQAYWLWDAHPGDSLVTTMKFTSRRVPASEIIHLYEKDRPGQLRGAPRLAVSLMRLRDLDEYEDAELVRKKIEACFAAFVTTPENNRNLANSQTETTDGITTRTESFAPGMIEYLRPGEEVSFGTPSSSSGIGEYTAKQLHAIAAGIGVTYQQLTGDLSTVNLSSIRAGMIDFNEMIDQTRWLTFIPLVCDRVYGWFVDAAYLNGTLRSAKVEVQWTPPKRALTDPLKEVQGMRLTRQAGLESTSEQIRALGMNPEDVFAELADENAALKKLGIVIDTDPANQVKENSSGAIDKSTDGNKPAGGTDGSSSDNGAGGTGDATDTNT